MSDTKPENGSSDLWGPIAPIMQPMVSTAVQMAKIWGNTLSAIVPGGASALNNFVSGAPSRSASSHAAASRYSVQVCSQRPTTVDVLLNPDAEFMVLSIDPLAPRLADADGEPPLLGVSLSCKDGHVTVRVAVEDSQPPGAFHGFLKDAGGNRRGEVTVTIAEAD